MSHYGYKDNISIDGAYGLMRRLVVTPANIHDSPMLPALLDADNAEAMVWANSAYSNSMVDSFLREAGYESRIQEEGSPQHPLGDIAKERNREGAKKHSRVEQAFGEMEMGMGGKLIYCHWFSQSESRVVFAESSVSLSQTHSA